MNKAAKKRLVIVGLIIVAVAAVLFAVVGSGVEVVDQAGAPSGGRGEGGGESHP